jgi:O-antigen/teichoic acid export membrane protein
MHSIDLPLPALARRLFRHGAWAIAGKAVMMGGGVLISVLLTRLLPPADVGAYFLALSVVTVAALIGRAGLEKSVLQFVAGSLGAGDPGRAKAAVRRVLTLALGSIAAAAVLTGAGGGRWIATALFDSESMLGIVGIMAPWIVYLAFESLIAEIFRGFHDIPRASAYGGAIGRSLCVLALLVLVLGVGSTSLRSVVLVTVGCGAVGLIPAGLALKKKLTRLGTQPARNPLPTYAVLATTWPLLLSNVTMYTMGHADIWIVGAFEAESQVALYSVAVRVVMLVGLSLAIVNGVLPPLIGEYYAQRNRREMEHVVRLAATVAALPSAVVLVGLVVAGGPVLRVAFGEFYGAGAPVLAILSVGQLVNVWVGSCGYVLIMSGHQRDLMWASVVSGVISVGGALGVVSHLGTVGVAGAVAVGTIVQQGLMLWLARRRCGIWTHASPLLLYGSVRNLTVHRTGV